MSNPNSLIPPFPILVPGTGPSSTVPLLEEGAVPPTRTPNPSALPPTVTGSGLVVTLTPALGEVGVSGPSNANFISPTTAANGDVLTIVAGSAQFVPPSGGSTATAIVDATSPAIAAGQGFMDTAGFATLADTTGLPQGQYPSGIALTGGGPLSTIEIVVQGLVPAAVLNLGGPGTACAVGLNAAGTPVRVTDPTCVSGLKFVGICDVTGAVYASPDVDFHIDAIKFGMDPTGVADCVPVFNAILTFINNNVCPNNIHFPAGRYRFNSGITIAGGRSIQLSGEGISNQLNPNVYKAGSQLLAYGGGTFLSWGTNGHNESGGIEIVDLEILGQLNTGFSATPASFNQIGLELLGVVGAYVRRCRFGSFQYQISIDGAEGTHITDCQFDGGGDGNGYQNVITNFDGANGLVITSASGTGVNPISLVFSGPTLIPTGGQITIVGALGNTAINGTFTFTSTGSNTGTIPATGNGVYVADSGTATSPIESSFAIRIGSFNFSVGNSANEAYITNATFNNSRWGILHQDGVTHIVDSCTYELQGGMAVLGSPENLVYTKCAGEAAQVALFWVTDWRRLVVAQTFAWELIGNYLGIVSGAPGILIDPSFGRIIAIDIRCNILLTSGVPFIKNAFYIEGNVARGGNYLLEPFSDGQTSTQMSTMVNDLADPTASLDVILTTYGTPMWFFRATELADVFIFSQGPTITSQFAQQTEQYEQLLVSGRRLSTRYGRGLVYQNVLTGAAATPFPVLTPSLALLTGSAGSGVFVIEVTAAWATTPANTVYWKIRQLFTYGVAGAVTLLSTPTTLDSDTTTDPTFVAPTISADGLTLAVTITGHPTEQTIWSVRGYIIEGANT